MDKSETLKQYLDRINIGPGDDSGFVVKTLFGNTTMEVSRRYLESEPMKKYLDMEIFDYIYPYINLYGQSTILFILDNKQA